MNADLLKPGSDVFYLQGTTGELVPAAVVGLSSFPGRLAISYEHPGHTQLYQGRVSVSHFPFCVHSPLFGCLPTHVSFPLGESAMFSFVQLY